MNVLKNVLNILDTSMNRPNTFGLFHIICLFVAILFIVYFCITKNKNDEKRLKKILIIYGVVAFLLEFLKQFSWTYRFQDNLLIRDYTWYAFPFQLCSTPIYVSIICAFLKKSKARDYLLSYMAYFTILGSLATAIYPTGVFTGTILINIHTMFLHFGSLVVSIYLLLSKEVKIDFKTFIKGFITFLLFAGTALLMNIIIYNIGILHGETFNMFYISPYFISELPVFNIIQPKVNYFVFLIIYIAILFLGGLFIFGVSKLISKIKKC